MPDTRGRHAHRLLSRARSRACHRRRRGRAPCPRSVARVPGRGGARGGGGAARGVFGGQGPVVWLVPGGGAAGGARPGAPGGGGGGGGGGGRRPRHSLSEALRVLRR